MSLALAGLAVAAIAVLAPLLSILRTSAQPVGGAAYAGTHSGGEVEFEVSADGSAVKHFKIANVTGDTCIQSEFSWPRDIPVADDSFSDSLAGSTVTGSFPSVGEARGTFKMYLPPEGPAPACESETLTWTATTDATPPATPSPPPTAAATPLPTATPAPTPGNLVAGWNQVCYLGASQDIEDALAGPSEHVLAVYSLRPGQGYDRWFPDRPELSTMSTLNPYRSLLILLASSTSWPQQPSSPAPPNAHLEQGWNSVCYAGETTDVPTATQSIEGQFGVLYALGSDQRWERFVPGRPDISDLTHLSRFASVLILVTQEGDTQWSFGP